MAEALVEPAVGAALIDFITTNRLALQLGSPTVSARVEDGQHIRIVETGGAGDREVVLFSQQVTVETFGPTLTRTSELMRKTFAGIRSLQHTTHAGVQFYGLRTFGAGNNSEDPLTKRPRYTRTFVIDVRLIPLS